MTIPTFRSTARPSFTLAEAIDALMAHDHGSTDSGISDPDLRSEVVAYLRGLPSDAYRRVVGEIARGWLGERRLAEGYGLDNVVGLADWLSDNQCEPVGDEGQERSNQ